MWTFATFRKTLAWVSIAFVSLTTGALAQSVSREPDTDRFGGDYAAFAVSDVGECQALCEGDARCKAFTFRKAAPVCWLKESGQAPTSDPRYISGLKGGIPDLTVVSVNMAGHGVVNGLNWQTRVDRLGDDIAASGPNSRPGPGFMALRARPTPTSWHLPSPPLDCRFATTRDPASTSSRCTRRADRRWRNRFGRRSTTSSLD